MKIHFLRSCFGCCELRTGVIIIAVIDLIFGVYEIVDFAIRVYFDLHAMHHSVFQNTTVSINVTAHKLTNMTNATNPTKMHVDKHDSKGDLYDDSAFAIIVIGFIDLFISSFLLYVAVLRKYELRIIVFVAAIWGFVMAFLSVISFAVSLALSEKAESSIFLLIVILEVFFGYVILSYFKFMTVVVERGLDDVHMSYFPGDPSSEFSEVQMDEAGDERPIMDDQDDFPTHGDGGKIVLT